MEPGQVITPNQNASEPQSGTSPDTPRPPDDSPPQPVPAPAPSPDPVVVATPQSQPVVSPPQTAAPVASARVAEPITQPAPEAPEADWQFHQSIPDPQQQPPLLEDLTWSASEFVAHEKNGSWYGVVLFAGLLVAAADYLLLKDIISSVAILMAAITFALLSSHKPRTQQYAMTPQGVQIGMKLYLFQDFKNFSITQERAGSSIVFMPLKRFMPALTIYVAPDMEDRVVDFLSAILPFEQHRPDAVDSLMRRIHF